MLELKFQTLIEKMWQTNGTDILAITNAVANALEIIELDTYNEKYIIKFSAEKICSNV